MRRQIKKIPILGTLARHIYRKVRGDLARSKPFPGSERYWIAHYAAGGDSGPGSYGRLAKFKAAIINDFVAEHAVASVVEFGCGDGEQLRLAKYQRYLGFDVSERAISLCRRLFASDATKQFKLMREYDGEKADLALSLDVIFHLVEDDVFENHMATLFGSSNRYVIIYSTNYDDNKEREGTHIRERRFTDWIRDNLPDWKLIRQVPNKFPYSGDPETGSTCEFFVYAKG